MVQVNGGAGSGSAWRADRRDEQSASLRLKVSWTNMSAPIGAPRMVIPGEEDMCIERIKCREEQVEWEKAGQKTVVLEALR